MKKFQNFLHRWC